MDGQDCYLIYKSIKVHFTTKSFDVRNHGFPKRMKAGFEERNDQAFFWKLGDLYKNRKELSILFASNFVYNSDIWIGDFVQEDYCSENYKRMRKALSSHNYHVIEDYKKILEKHGNFESSLDFKNQPLPDLINDVVAHEINPESLVVFDRLFKCFDYIESQDFLKVIWPSVRMRFEKFRPFVFIDSVETLESIRQEIEILDISYQTN